jgi:hypothetical protein
LRLLTIVRGLTLLWFHRSKNLRGRVPHKLQTLGEECGVGCSCSPPSCFSGLTRSKSRARIAIKTTCFLNCVAFSPVGAVSKAGVAAPSRTAKREALASTKTLDTRSAPAGYTRSGKQVTSASTAVRGGPLIAFGVGVAGRERGCYETDRLAICHGRWGSGRRADHARAWAHEFASLA